MYRPAEKKTKYYNKEIFADVKILGSKKTYKINIEKEKIKKKEIDNKLKQLTDLRKELTYLSDNCHGDDKPNCPILDELSKN